MITQEQAFQLGSLADNYAEAYFKWGKALVQPESTLATRMAAYDKQLVSALTLAEFIESITEQP